MIPLLIWNLQQSGSRQNVQIHDHAQVFFFFGLFFEGERQKKKFHFFHFSIFIFKELFLYQGKFYKSASRKIQFRTIAIRGDSFVKMVVYILKKKRKKKKPTVVILSFSFPFSFHQWLYLWHRGNSVSLISSDILTWVDKEIEVVDEIRSSISLRQFPFSIRSCTNRVTMMIEVWWYFKNI